MATYSQNPSGSIKLKVTGILTLIAAIAVLIIGTLCFNEIFHKQENQNLAIIQSMGGNLEVRRTPGWWVQICPTITEYPKAGIYRLNAGDKDSLSIQFNNKTTADMNCQIGYRIDGATDEMLIALHQQVEGKDEKIWQMVWTALNTSAQSITTKYDPSAVIGGEKFEPMVKELYTAMIHNPELLRFGIDVNYFAVDGRPIPDKETAKQFEQQKNAALAKQLALAEKETLEAEKIKTQAKYEKEIAEQRGQAEAQMAKEVQNAERTKKLAEIAASQKVEVEKLAKEQMLVQMAKEKEAAEIAVQKAKAVALVEAQKIREVAEIQKQTEAANLEKVKFIAQQQIAAAEAKQIAIEKSGAITEIQRAQLDLELGIAKAKWESIGKGMAGITLPKIMNIGGEGGQTTQAPLDTLIQTMTLEKLNEVIKTPVPPKPVIAAAKPAPVVAKPAALVPPKPAAKPAVPPKK